MPRMIFSLVVVVALVGPSVVGGTEDHSPGTVTLSIEGMTCGSCAHRIQAELTRLEGVREARVSFDTSDARVNFDPELADLSRIVATIEKLGYSVAGHPAKGKVPSGKPASCFTPAGVAADSSGAILGEGDLDRVVSHVIDILIATDGDLSRLSGAEIETATGISIPEGEAGRIQTSVVARLMEENPDILAKLSAGSRCAEYDACSLDGDLSGATGEKVVRYRREKETDGATFRDLSLASFEARNLEGETVSTGDLAGRPAVIALLAGHCTHSMNSIPILQETARDFGDTELQVIGLWVNSGDPVDIRAWIDHYQPRFQVWVHNDPGLGDRIDSHLVPTWLFVDAGGQVREKLVGYKDPGTVNTWIRTWIEPGPASG